MGLDMYLKVSKNVYKGRYYADPMADQIPDDVWGLIDNWADPEADGKSVTIEGVAIYWRKANSVHKWFVDNCQGSVDECQETEVSVEQLTVLRNLIKKAVRTKNAALLPPQGGFFFGSTDIDEDYWEDLRWTRDRLTELLEKLNVVPANERPRITYQSSW